MIATYLIVSLIDRKHKRRRKEDAEYIAWLERIDNTPTEELVVDSGGQAIQQWIESDKAAMLAGFSSSKEYNASMNKPPAVPMILTAEEAAYLCGYSFVEAYNTDVYAKVVAREDARLARLRKAALVAARFQSSASRVLFEADTSSLPDASTSGITLLGQRAQSTVSSSNSLEYDILPSARPSSPVHLAADAAPVGDTSGPVTFLPFRFQVMLFQSRLSSAARFVGHSYPSLSRKVYLVQNALHKVIGTLPPLHGLAREMPPEFSYKYASVVATRVDDVDKHYMPLLSVEEFEDKRVVFSRARRFHVSSKSGRRLSFLHRAHPPKYCEGPIVFVGLMGLCNTATGATVIVTVALESNQTAFFPPNYDVF
ncbi:hypothetical protein C8R43DRAFT_963431 [Mycena crocata]|nr:hypothetical protein C8R43DRAFT_963431 [Mycena crocata]